MCIDWFKKIKKHTLKTVNLILIFPFNSWQNVASKMWVAERIWQIPDNFEVKRRYEQLEAWIEVFNIKDTENSVCCLLLTTHKQKNEQWVRERKRERESENDDVSILTQAEVWGGCYEHCQLATASTNWRLWMLQRSCLLIRKEASVSQKHTSFVQFIKNCGQNCFGCFIRAATNDHFPSPLIWLLLFNLIYCWVQKTGINGHHNYIKQVMSPRVMCCLSNCP